MPSTEHGFNYFLFDISKQREVGTQFDLKRVSSLLARERFLSMTVRDIVFQLGNADE
jgi:hypothetical protein